jgi:hypothetical protein
VVNIAAGFAPVCSLLMLTVTQATEPNSLLSTTSPVCIITSCMIYLTAYGRKHVLAGNQQLRQAAAHRQHLFWVCHVV